MNAARFALLTLIALTSTVAFAEEEKKATKLEIKLPELPKLDTAKSEDGAGTAAPEDNKPKLDVSRMMFGPEAIRTVVNFHMPEIQECYEKVLSDTGKKIEGKLVVGFVINPDGNVSVAKPLKNKSTMKDDRVIDCVLALRTWSFPKPSDNRDYPIEYPFMLSVKK